jgi:tetratricopeptide (TPR) repeat protein
MESALHYSFALFYEQKGLMERAESEFQMVVDYSHNPGWARNEMGDFYRRTERHSLAIDQYQRSLAQRPDDPSTQYNLAMAFHSDGQLEHAIAAMERAIGLRPDRSMWHGTLGNFLFSVGRMDDAVRAYEQAILLDPNLIQAHCNLARAYEGAGRVCEAVDEYLLCASETESQDQREYARSRAEELECRP